MLLFLHVHNKHLFLWAFQHGVITTYQNQDFIGENDYFNRFPASELKRKIHSSFAGFHLTLTTRSYFKRTSSTRVWVESCWEPRFLSLINQHQPVTICKSSSWLLLLCWFLSSGWLVPLSGLSWSLVSPQKTTLQQVCGVKAPQACRPEGPGAALLPWCWLHAVCPPVWPQRTQMDTHSVLAVPHNCRHVWVHPRPQKDPPPRVETRPPGFARSICTPRCSCYTSCVCVFAASEDVPVRCVCCSWCCESGRWHTPPISRLFHNTRVAPYHCRPGPGDAAAEGTETSDPGDPPGLSRVGHHTISRVSPPPPWRSAACMQEHLQTLSVEDQWKER